VDDRCVNDGAGADTDALAFQVMVHRVQHLTAQIVLLKQVAEAKNGRFVRRRGYPKVNSCEAAKHRRLIEGFFHARIRQAEPLLQKVSPKHDRDSHRLATVARLGVMRLDQSQQFAPRNDLLHMVQKQLPLALAAMLLKTRLRCQCLLNPRHPLHAYSLFK